jgi:hypothetical protein
MQAKRQLSFASAAGLCRGATGAAVDNLQEFLRRFGYLHVAPEGDPYAAVRAISRPPTAKPGVFDDDTVVALCNYQQFHRLPITGRLDLATAAHMSRPRCGFPDIPYASGSSKFATLGSEWRRNDLTFGFQNFTPDLTQEEVRDAIVTAFGLWSHVTPLTFREVEDNPDILIRFVAGDHGDGVPFDDGGGVLAHAFPPPSNGSGPGAGDVHFDEAENWTVTLPAFFSADLITIAAHEFGHSLGLDHTTVDGALMEAVYSGPHRHLAQDDISGIQSIYGPRLVERGNLLHLSGVTTDGHLWHTIRFPSSDWAPLGDVEGMTGDRGFIMDVDLQSVSDVVHLCAINSSGGLWHTIRRANGSWFPFGDVEGMTGDRGSFVRVGIAEVNGELHVCGVTSDGHLWHTIRRADSSWLPFGDIEGMTGDRGAFVDIDCAGVNGELHVCGVTSNGRLWHTIRRANGGWLPFGDVEGMTGDRGMITEAACAGVAGELQVCSVSSDGHLWHTIRRANGSWLPFGDVEGMTGDRGSFARLAAGESGGELHVCGVTSDGRLWHTIRRADGSWLPFGDVEGMTGDRGSFRTVSADGIFIP